MGIVFGEGSKPNMNYGDCLPCECDPIAATVPCLGLDDLPCEKFILQPSAANNLVAVAVIVHFISVTDSYFATDASVLPWPAQVSPGRNALTAYIASSAQSGQALDFTDEPTVYGILLQAYSFSLDTPQERRLQAGMSDDMQKEMRDLAKYLVTMMGWLDGEMSSSSTDVLLDVRSLFVHLPWLLISVCDILLL
jgi:hypothetical protein